MEFEVVNNSGSDLGGSNPTVIKVVGCGGGGSNAVNRMIEANIENVEFIAMNTDLQALGKSVAANRIAIGQKITQGLGCGGDPSIGEKAAEEDKEAITNILRGAHMVFVTAGMGGGTGTGSAPVVAKIARELGALTVGIVTTPFSWEGKRRMDLAEEGLKKLQEAVDSVIVIPNRKICEVFGNGLSFVEQYRAADDLLRQSIEGMSTIITRYGTPNIDFADVRAAMKGQGTAIFGIGKASGENRAVEAATKAINNPLLEDTNIDGAKHFLINVCASSDFQLNELEEISGIVCASADKNYDLKPGIVVDSSMGDEISVTVIATGFNGIGNVQEETVEIQRPVEEKKPVDTNTISSDDFAKLLAGDRNASAAETPVLFNMDEDSHEQERESGLNTYVAGFNPVKPAVSQNIDPNDINTPAFLRKRPLSRTIDFDRK